jgi:molybdopterin-guanine dinucleotide biosynthesis protein A
VIPEPIVGLILAGGQSRRMGGGDKALRLLGGQPLLSHIVDRLRPQCPTLVLNATGDAHRFATFGLPVVADAVGDQLGPLAGVLAGLDWVAAHAPEAAMVLTVPGDAPFLPADLAARLWHAQQAEAAELAVAASAGQLHHVTGLWPVRLRHDLRAAVEVEGLRKVELWASRYRRAVVSWTTEPVDPFFNINRPEDLAAAEQVLATRL